MQTITRQKSTTVQRMRHLAKREGTRKKRKGIIEIHPKAGTRGRGG